MQVKGGILIGIWDEAELAAIKERIDADRASSWTVPSGAEARNRMTADIVAYGLRDARTLPQDAPE